MSEREKKSDRSQLTAFQINLTSQPVSQSASQSFFRLFSQAFIRTEPNWTEIVINTQEEEEDYLFACLFVVGNYLLFIFSFQQQQEQSRVEPDDFEIRRKGCVSSEVHRFELWTTCLGLELSAWLGKERRLSLVANMTTFGRGVAWQRWMATRKWCLRVFV